MSAPNIDQSRLRRTREPCRARTNRPALFPVALDRTVAANLKLTRPAPTPAHPSADEEVCWICLEGSTNDKVELIRPCKCPRVVHARCMARWQLQCSGKDEELHCKFCNQDLPNWRKTLFRDVMDDDAETEAEEEAV